MAEGGRLQILAATGRDPPGEAEGEGDRRLTGSRREARAGAAVATGARQVGITAAAAAK